MRISRCADVMIAAIVNQLDEVWISQHPALLWCHAAHYASSVTRSLFPHHKEAEDHADEGWRGWTLSD